jgi:hypothetical protein
MDSSDAKPIMQVLGETIAMKSCIFQTDKVMVEPNKKKGELLLLTVENNKANNMIEYIE